MKAEITTKHVTKATDFITRHLGGANFAPALATIFEAGMREAFLAGKESRLQENYPHQALPNMPLEQQKLFQFMMLLKALTFGGFELHYKTTSYFKQQEKQAFINIMGILEKQFNQLQQHPLFKVNADYLDNHAALFLELTETAFKAKNGAKMLAVVECFMEGLLFMEGEDQPFGEEPQFLEKEVAA